MGDNLKKIKGILSELGIEKIISRKTNKGNNYLMELEKKYSFTFPDEYKEFLLSYGEVFFESEVEFKPIERSPLTTVEGKQYLDGFIGIDRLSEEIGEYENRMPNSIIPIGECPGGNLICLGVKKSTFGKIYFWNHENEIMANLMVESGAPANDIDSYWENIYLVSHTFIDFLNNLETSQDNLEDKGVDDVELWLDDDLLDD